MKYFLALCLFLTSCASAPKAFGPGTVALCTVGGSVMPVTKYEVVEMYGHTFIDDGSAMVPIEDCIIINPAYLHATPQTGQEEQPSGMPIRAWGKGR